MRIMPRNEILENPVSIEELQSRLKEAEEALEAIRNGEVDAIIVNSESGDKIFSLTTSDTPYRIILEEMDEGAVILDLRGIILYSNSRMINLISDSTKQVLGSNLRKYILPADKAKFSRLLKKARSERAKGVISFLGDEFPIYLNLSFRPLPEGMSGDICVIASDVTNLRQNQLHLKKLVKKRTIDLEKANEKLRKDLVARKKNELDLRESEERLKQSEIRLKELVATKDKFFNIVAHDLKNPFTSLIGSSELLSKSITQMNPDRITALATIFNDAAKNGYAILENLLDWSRSQTGLLKYDPEILNLRLLMDEQAMNVHHNFTHKEIEVLSLVDEDLYIYADQYMIKTILRNLLSNAIKFTFRKGQIIINAVEKEGEVVVSVKDSGTGISPENIEKIFRIDSKFSLPGTENETGTGLGLKLCKEFIEKQGGNIWVESTVNIGSEFKFTVPAMKPQ
jgi:PAS domain S-box-containing protein